LTPLGVLAEARAAGLLLRPEGEALRVRPAERLTPELRAKLQALKPEVLELLSVRHREATAAWAAAYARLAACGWPGRDAVERLRPVLLHGIDEAEESADAATLEYRSGEGSPAHYQVAVARWERLVRAAAWAIAGLCHDCGRPTLIAAGDPLTGERYCPRCLRIGPSR
jgi:hypothetical protein